MYEIFSIIAMRPRLHEMSVRCHKHSEQAHGRPVKVEPDTNLQMQRYDSPKNRNTPNSCLSTEVNRAEINFGQASQRAHSLDRNRTGRERDPVTVAVRRRAFSLNPGCNTRTTSRKASLRGHLFKLKLQRPILISLNVF